MFLEKYAKSLYTKGLNFKSVQKMAHGKTLDSKRMKENERKITPNQVRQSKNMSLADAKIKMKTSYKAKLKEKINWGKEKRDDSSVRNRNSSSWCIPHHPSTNSNSHKTSQRVYDPNVHPYRDALARAKLRSNSQLDGKTLEIQ